MDRNDELIRLEGLQRRYGRLLAFDAGEVVLPRGAIGLLGPNGAGKTTLLKLLLGLLPPTAGRAWVLGFDVSRQGLTVRSRLGYMSENDTFVPGLTPVELTALSGELCRLPRREALRRAHESLDCVGLGEERYRQVEELSTGMRQRVKLAQALVHDPELLVLDEPTAGLDPGGRRAMLDLIRRLHREEGKSFILSTHILDDVDRVCDSVLILDRGRVLACGRTDALKLRRRDIYRVRFEGEARQWLDLLAARGAQIEPATRKVPGGVEVRIQLAPGLDVRCLLEVLLEANGRAGGEDGKEVILQALVPEEESLEDVFERLVGAGEP